MPYGITRPQWVNTKISNYILVPISLYKIFHVFPHAGSWDEKKYRTDSWCLHMSEFLHSHYAAPWYVGVPFLWLWPSGIQVLTTSTEDKRLWKSDTILYEISPSTHWPLGDLTHWGWDKMAAISQTILSNAFSWMKMLENWLKFHQILFLSIQLTSSDQATSHYLNHWWLDYWRIYASLGPNGLNEILNN